MRSKRQSVSIRVLPVLLTGFFVVLFALGGSARSDVIAIILLRPLAAIIAAWALLRVSREALIPFRFIVGFYLACVILVLAHLVPLPPAIWQSLPGRALEGQAAALAGTSRLWYPTSLVPHESWNALFALLVPLAAAAVWMTSSTEHRRLVLPLLLGIAGTSVLLGILQIASGARVLYFYPLTNLGSPVGLFANRNHHAVFLAATFPMLACFASLARTPRGWMQRLAVAALATIALLPLLLIMGSRSGLLTAIVGLAGALWLYRAPYRKISRHRKNSRLWNVRPLYAAAAAGVVVVAVTLALAKGEALTRLAATGGTAEVRLPHWQVIAHIIGQYMPLGSGIGSFVEVYQIAEPQTLIESAYLNHAHNELLEVALTAGLPGIALVLVALIAWSRSAWLLGRAGRNREPSIMLGQMGGIVVLILGLGSLVDYPLRTPSLLGLFVTAALWMAEGVHSIKRAGQLPPDSVDYEGLK